jgi:pimeloyl-ACP methyl ester carboxylesterase
MRNAKGGSMSRRRTAQSPLVTAEEWLGGGRRVWYDPGSGRVVGDGEAANAGSGVGVFERIAAADLNVGEDGVWLTMLPGFPDGSYGWARVDRSLGDSLGPRLYVEPVGQGDSDKPTDYEYSTVERADLVEALWRYHNVARTVVVAFDYTAMALLELLRHRMEGTSVTPRSRPRSS